MPLFIEDAAPRILVISHEEINIIKNEFRIAPNHIPRFHNTKRNHGEISEEDTLLKAHDRQAALEEAFHKAQHLALNRHKHFHGHILVCYTLCRELTLEYDGDRLSKTDDPDKGRIYFGLEITARDRTFHHSVCGVKTLYDGILPVYPGDKIYHVHTGKLLSEVL